MVRFTCFQFSHLGGILTQKLQDQSNNGQGMYVQTFLKRQALTEPWKAGLVLTWRLHHVDTYISLYTCLPSNSKQFHSLMILGKTQYTWYYFLIYFNRIYCYLSIFMFLKLVPHQTNISSNRQNICCWVLVR